MSKAILIDTTRCAACRGCQVRLQAMAQSAGKSHLPDGRTQNPPDLNPFNFKLVRFSERTNKRTAPSSGISFPRQCRHCVTPICRILLPIWPCRAPSFSSPKQAFVLFTEKTALLSPGEDVKAVTDACPYNIPRYNPQTRLLVKCDMCVDRVNAGLPPICVQTCPAGCMVFGNREEILDLAAKRLDCARTASSQSLPLRRGGASTSSSCSRETEILLQICVLRVASRPENTRRSGRSMPSPSLDIDRDHFGHYPPAYCCWNQC